MGRSAAIRTEALGVPLAANYLATALACYGAIDFGTPFSVSGLMEQARFFLVPPRWGN
jgi:hypothetical protein